MGSRLCFSGDFSDASIRELRSCCEVGSCARPEEKAARASP